MRPVGIASNGGHLPSFASRSLLAISLFVSAAAAQSPVAKGVAITDVRIGFDGAVKAACWTPIAVDIESKGIDAVAALVITTNDAEGIPTRLVLPNLAIAADRKQTIRHFVKIGDESPTIDLALESSSGTLARQTITPNSQVLLAPQSPQTAIVVGLGSPAGLLDLNQADSGLASFRHHVALINRVSELPRQWFAFESIDALVMTTADAKVLDALDDEHRDAIRSWVRQGGRLVVSIGGNWQVASKSFLADMLPARIDGLEQAQRLGSEVRAIEILAGGKKPLEVGDNGIQVLQLSDIRGKVLPAIRRDQPTRPVVVQAAYGLGAVTLIGFDVESSPFREWEGRSEFWFNLLGLQRDQADMSKPRYKYGYLGASQDVGGWIDRQLDRFSDVSTVPFSAVAILILGYILLIGPIDYLLLKRGFGKLELTWITFPIWVVAVSVAAYYAAYWLKGDDLRVNRIEFLDVDAGSSTLRGKNFVSIFSPVIERYSVATRPGLAAGGTWQELGAGRSPVDRVTSWLGNVAEMRRGPAPSGGFFGSGRYDFATPDPTAVLQAPIKVWSVKTFTSEWLAKADPVLDLELHRGNALSLEPELAGNLTNRLPTAIRNAVLLWGDYAFLLGSLPAANGSHTSTVKLALSMQKPLSTFLSEHRQAPEHEFSYAYRGDGQFGDGAMSFAVNLTVSTRDKAGSTEMGNHALAQWSLKHLLDVGKAVLVGQVDVPAGELWIQPGSGPSRMADPAEKSVGPPPVPGQEQRTTFLRIVVEPKTND